MSVKSLKCRNFRNLSDIELIPHKGMNVICGENAQGKTNILEAIWLFSGAKSFRGAKETAFLKLGEQKGRNSLVYEKEGIDISADMEFSEKRTVFINGKQQKGPAALAGQFNAIVFSPVDLSLINDGPSARRKFLDIGIGQLYPSYISFLRDYSKAVLQRNQTLKDYRYDASLGIMLDIFEEEIANKGKRIIEMRIDYLERLKKYIPDIYFGLSSGREKISAEYIKTADENEILDALAASRREDSYSATTSIGPHRDDIDFKINGMSARQFGSQGQRRSIALSVKFAGAEVINEISGEYPVCLLDDVMSELDPLRQNYILNHIKGWQCFLSCCDPSDFKGLEEGKIFEVKKGEVECISI